MHAELGRRASRALTWVMPALLLGACTLLSPQVDPSARAHVERHIHRNMTMTDARAEMEGMHYRCRTRTGSWFDADGTEHPTDIPFVACTEEPTGWFSFSCGQRNHVVLVPRGTRVGRIVIDKTPSCAKP